MKKQKYGQESKNKDKPSGGMGAIPMKPSPLKHKSPSLTKRENDTRRKNAGL